METLQLGILFLLLILIVLLSIYIVDVVPTKAATITYWRTVNLGTFIGLFLIIGVGIALWQNPPFTIPQTVLILGQLSLTLILAYYHFSTNPDPMVFRRPNITPTDADGAIIAEESYKIPEQNQETPIVEPKREGFGANFPIIRRFRPWKVECTEQPSKMKATFDISNKGATGTTLHELRLKELGKSEAEEKIVGLFDDTYLLDHPFTQEAYEEWGSSWIQKKYNKLNQVYSDVPEAGNKLSWLLHPKRISRGIQSDRRRYLKPKERIYETHPVPIDESGLEPGEDYQFRVELHSASATPTDSLDITVKITESDNIEMYTDRYLSNQWNWMRSRLGWMFFG